jgi:multiple sugar transport system ATP-binding protein
MHNGLVQQFASPQELYSQPANLFVAGFVGTPAMNLLSGSVLGNAVSSGSFSILLPPSASMIDGEPVVAGVRPEDLAILPRPEGGGGPIGQIVVVEPQGDERIVSVALGDDAGAGMPVWKIRASKHGPAAHLAVGDLVGLVVRPRGLRLFDAMTEERVL